MNRILVLSPHPDDECLGCGGTLRKHVVEGDLVCVIFLTSGEHGGHGTSLEKTKHIRETEAKEAARIIGYNDFEFWREPNGKLHVSQRLVLRLQSKLRELNPDLVYVTHDHEMHPEHCSTARLVRRAIASSLPLKVKPIVYMYEVWTPLQHVDHIVDISPYIDMKRDAICAHKSQCAVMNFEEAFLGLNRYRGEMHSWPGGKYAEIFKILKY